MTRTVDVFWSFRSPFSYLATPDLLKLRDDYDVSVQFRPVLPIAVRAKESLFTDDPRRVRYIMLDMVRRAEFLGMPFGRPSPDPVVQDLNTFEVADEQPYIYRLTGLGIEAERRGKGLDFAFHVAALIWSGTPGWNEGDRLGEATAKAGLDLAEMEAALAAEDPMPQIEANQAALDASGHWGVPTMVFEGEPFFGQDRVETLRWRLDQAGLAKG
ncbi:DSBA-like thioredoxin domain protein [Rhodobacteraceae bacterium THAF1]|uniref:2-hydroxychromene-2-carboxylate isomerase n=1 Tax=Palleronia sp. THAF1 TaxID=2587842 RepID=UPI000F3EB20F|nr:DsbA family protein [Palleronia sp. THAF1]QFU08619.1 DSBA-like thioredoxin domain protein [Palleronia sp. THAF1]VDC30734.1 DSBA-like thioredoxin domain protein [Rhodobacteraceae bacterium THAF1]